MLYTMLVGKPPFDTDGVRMTLTRVVKGSYQLPNHISAQAKDLIQRLLRKLPSERLPLTGGFHRVFLLEFIRYIFVYKCCEC